MPEATLRDGPQQPVRRPLLVVAAGIAASFAAFAANSTGTIKNMQEFFSGGSLKVEYSRKIETESIVPNRRPEPINLPERSPQPVSFGAPETPVQKPSTVSADTPQLPILPTFYNFGDQVLRADFNGDLVYLYYVKTNDTMSRLHAQGQLYGILSINGTVVSGWAQGRSEKCKPEPFPVSGFANIDRTFISFSGKFPFVDSDTCAIVGHKDTHAVLSKL